MSVERPVLIAALFATVLGGAPGDALAQETEAPRRRLHFSGLVDADFASDFDTFDRLAHRSGLEIDLTTHTVFSPTLYALVRTTMRDGNVPREGAGATWAPLAFDGAQVNWKPGAKTILMAGDLVAGAGYFQYARYKRSAAVVGEHSVRGVGLRYGSILVHTGVAGDSSGQNQDWSVFARWTRPMNESMTWTPTFRYSAGLGKAQPFELGVSFDGSFVETIDIHAHVGMNYWDPDTDPGSVILIEPRVTYGQYFFAGTFLYSDKGEVPSPNAPRLTSTWRPIEDVLFQLEPGIALDKTFSTGLSLEYRNQSVNRGRDESVWLIPTLYVFPAQGAEWWVWGGLEKPLYSGAAGHPRFSLGSEIFFSF